LKHALPAVLFVLAAVTAGHAAVFKGTVLDAYTRQPVPYARVEVFGTGRQAWAEEDGTFRLNAEVGPVTLGVSRVGYRQRTWSGLPVSEPAELYLLPEVIDLEGVTVSAFRTPVPLAEAGPVSIIENSEARSGARTALDQALRTTLAAVPRDNVNFSSISLRGTNAEHAMVAIDGVRLNSAQNGTFDLTTMPLGFADRVEVTRGGNSALYGTSPVGGMVNVVTPEPAEMRARVRGGIGALGRRLAELYHENRLGLFGYAVGGNYASADNEFNYENASGDEETMTNADFEGLGGFGKLLFSNGPHRASLFGEYASTKRGSPGPRNWPSDDARRDDTRLSAIGSYTFQPNENLRTGVRAFRVGQWQNFRDPDSLFPINDTHDLVDMGIHVDQLWYPCPWAMLMAGVELDDHRLNSTAVGAPSRTDIAGWAQARVEYSGFSVNPQARFERLDQRGETDESSVRTSFSPKLTVSWSASGWLNVFAGIGRSFRAPSLNDLFWPADLFSYGNPDLEPELSTNVDLGVRGSAGETVSWWVGGYWSDLTNLIQWQPDTLFLYRPVSVAEATILGVEAEASLDLDFVGLDASANWSQAESDGERLYYRPDLTAHAELWFEHEFDPVAARVHLAATHSGDRLSDPVFPDTMPATLDGYTLLDAGAVVSPRIGPLTAAVRFGVRNLLDQRYETVDFYPNPGRTWYSELELGI